MPAAWRMVTGDMAVNKVGGWEGGMAIDNAIDEVVA
jgi:hypothetical protein